MVNEEGEGPLFSSTRSAVRKDVPSCVLEAMQAAANWRLLGLLFERPRPGWLDGLRKLAGEVTDPELKVAAREAECADEGSYLLVLGPGGSVSPREVAYRPMADPGKVLSEINGYYQAFAYCPRTEDPADHVAVEMGFVGYLALKEAYALAREDAEEASTTREAIGSFLQEHLSCFVAELPQRLKESTKGHLRAAATILGKVSLLPVKTGCPFQ